MALIENDELDSGEFAEIEDTPQTPEVKANVPEVPEKYRGKSFDDIVKMHEEAEKLIGRHAQEVGEVRKLADELLKQQLASTKKEPVEEETEVDFFEDPKKAVAKAVDKHPAVVAAKEATERLKRTENQAFLRNKHPDMLEVVQDANFIEWVKGSKVRMKLYTEADANFDVDAADELLSTYKQIRQAKTAQTKDDGVELRQKSLKSAAVDVGGTGETSRKIYRRADLIRLRMDDPDRYAALGPEIMKAYNEGRVK